MYGKVSRMAERGGGMGRMRRGRTVHVEKEESWGVKLQSWCKGREKGVAWAGLYRGCGMRCPVVMQGMGRRRQGIKRSVITAESSRVRSISKQLYY